MIDDPLSDLLLNRFGELTPGSTLHVELGPDGRVVVSDQMAQVTVAGVCDINRDTA